MLFYSLYSFIHTHYNILYSTEESYWDEGCCWQRCVYVTDQPLCCHDQSQQGFCVFLYYVAFACTLWSALYKISMHTNVEDVFICCVNIDLKSTCVSLKLFLMMVSGRDWVIKQTYEFQLSLCFYSLLISAVFSIFHVGHAL